MISTNHRTNAATNDALDRLFRAAAQARPDPASAMPASLQARVLAERREWLARHAHHDFGVILSLVRRCLVGATLIAVGTALVCQHLEASRVPPMESMMLETVAEMTSLP